MNSTRTKYSIINIMTGVAGQVVNILLSFLNRSIFLAILGIVYASLNGLFMNILAVLSLAELGVGDAIIFSLYKPIADGQKEKIKSLMGLYKKAYRYIGLFIAVSGVLMIPFINYLLPQEQRVNGVITIYLLFLFNSVISYFYAYKKSIILANQQGYINNIYTTIFTLLKSIFQIVFLIITKSFIVYLIIQIISTFLTNLYISKKANKMYEYLNEEYDELDKEETKSIIENIKSLTIYKIGGVLLNSIDNIIITKFVGLNWVGYVANYSLIINSVNMVLSNVFAGITASVGNLIATESDERKYFMFKVINLVNFWLFGFSAIAILILSDFFIELWIGSKYIMNWNIVLILGLNFYLIGMQNSIWVFRGATGMFKETKFIILITAGINLVLSIMLSKSWGVFGVFIATTIARIFTNVWYEPFILFKNYFKVSSVKYFINFTKYFIIFILGYILTDFMVSFNNLQGIIGFCINVVSVIFIPNFIILVLLFKTEEFKYIKGKIINMLREKLKKEIL